MVAAVGFFQKEPKYSEKNLKLKYHRKATSQHHEYPSTATA